MSALKKAIIAFIAENYALHGYKDCTWGWSRKQENTFGKHFKIPEVE